MKKERPIYCNKCYHEMVKVKIYKAGREYEAKVCTDCGRIISNDGIFKTKG